RLCRTLPGRSERPPDDREQWPLLPAPPSTAPWTSPRPAVFPRMFSIYGYSNAWVLHALRHPGHLRTVLADHQSVDRDLFHLAVDFHFEAVREKSLNHLPALVLAHGPGGLRLNVEDRIAG